MKKLMVGLMLTFSLVTVAAFAFDDDTYEVSSDWHITTADHVELSLTYTGTGSRLVKRDHFVARMEDGTSAQSVSSSLHDRRINERETLTGIVGFRKNALSNSPIAEIVYAP